MELNFSNTKEQR